MIKSLDELNSKFHKNYRVDGFGIGNIWVHSPCPFCAEPDFMKYEMLEIVQVVSKEHICSSCGRGSKAIVTEPQPGAQRFEFVQTRGEPMPSWFPKMRVLESN